MKRQWIPRWFARLLRDAYRRGRNDGFTEGFNEGYTIGAQDRATLLMRGGQ